MPPVTPRRSARAPKPNPRYEDEVPWNDDTLRLLRTDSDISDDSSSSGTSPAQPNQDVEMGDVEPADVDSEDFEMEDAAEEEEDEEEDAVPENRHVTIDPPTPSPSVSDDDRPIRQKTKPLKSSFRMARKDMYPQVFGPDVEDLHPVLQSRDLWHINTRDLVFPSRATLKEALRLDAKDEYLERKRKEDTDIVPSNHQQIEPLTRDEAIAGRYLEIGEAHDVVLGPSDAGQKHTIQHYQSYQIGQAWLRPSADGVSNPENLVIDDAYHKGWLLNLGARPQCLTWAPSLTDDQFLAVTFRCSKPQRDTAPPRDSKIAPAFSPSPAYSSRIEIWRVKAKSGADEEPAQLDHHTPPCLVRVLCTRYGNIIKMEWLPISRTSGQHSLCILSSDGNIRILTLDPDDREAPLYLHIKRPQFIAAPPPNTIFTSFNLPSPHDLFAADAAGAVHLFSLLSDSNSLTPYSTIQIHMTYITAITSVPARPYYICTSSAGGEYILTDLRSPIIDRVRLQSARVPTRNLAYLPFTRTFLTTLDSASRWEAVSYHGSVVVSHSLRDFKMQKPILRLPQLGGLATVMTASQFHPIIMIGSAGGTVFACNYLRRCLPIGNAKKDKVGAWMVRAFEYEWRGLTRKEMEERDKEREIEGGNEMPTDTSLLGNVGTTVDTTTTTVTNDTNSLSQDTPSTQIPAHQPTKPDSDQDRNAIDLYHGPSTPTPGIGRFTEGFAPERAMVSNLDTSRSSTGKFTSKGNLKSRPGSKMKSRSKSKNKSKSKSKSKAGSKARPKNVDSDVDDYVHADDDEDEDADIDNDDAEAERESKGADGASQVIYHEEQAVTGMAWNGNENPRFASWVAISWGSGIVRICDLGHDMV